MLPAADGTLAASSTAIYTPLVPQASGQSVDVLLQNTGGSTETVLLTLTRSGGGTPRLARAVLATNEQLLVQGIVMGPGDVLKGQSTDASVVTYYVTQGTKDVPLTIQALDANGALKQVNTGVSGNQTISGVMSATGYTEPPVTLTGSADAIPQHTSATYILNRAGIDAATLAAPTATTDDGVTITVTSNTAFAHTLTSTGNLQTGGTTVNTATFAAHPGASVTLCAYQGKWNVQASNGITFS